MGFLFFVAVIGVIIYLSTQSSKATRQKWRTAAHNLKLGYYEGGIGSSGTITGERSGHNITVSTHTKGSGNNSQTYTKYLMAYRKSIPLDIKMTRQGALHKLGQVFGLQDIEVGNAVFDDQVVVRGSPPDAVRRFLTPKLQEAIRTLVMLYPDSVISSENVIVKKAGKDTDPSLICHCIRRLESFCNEMVSTQQAPPKPKNVYKINKQPPPIPVVDRNVPPIAEMIEPSVEPVAPAHPRDSDFPEIPEVPEAEPGLEPEPIAHSEEPGAMQEPPPLEEMPEQVENAPPERIEVDLEQVAVELYGGDTGSSLLTAKKFEERYKNRPVSGSGALRRVSKFNYDPVFTNCTGVIATFDIIELPGPYSKVKVAAGVKFPTEEYDALKAKVGQSLPITGFLVAQDTMMHQLYIADD
jgi:hypothetical protein